jgi:amino acid transporter
VKARAAAGLAVLVAGLLIALLADARSTLWIAGWGVAGVGAVLLTGLLFYEVGRSEDRARERGDA